MSNIDKMVWILRRNIRGNIIIHRETAIDPDTGSFGVKEKVYDKPFVDEAGYLIGVQRSGIKMWKDFKLPEDFTWADKGRVRELSRFLVGGTFQELIYRGNKGKQAVDICAFEKIIDLSHDRALKFLRKLKKNNILKEIVFLEQTYFVMNPKYGLYKRRMHPIVYKLYRKEMADLLPPYIIKEYERVIREEKYISSIKIKE